MQKITTSVFCILFCHLLFSQTWHRLEGIPVEGNRYDDVFFIDDYTGWAAGGAGKVYKTTDGGSSWIEQLHIPDSYFRNIEFLNHDIGFLGTVDSAFYRTTDGGTTWDLVPLSPNPRAICGLDAVGTSTIYGCGSFLSPAYIIKSVDSGESWEFIDMSAYADGLVEILFIDEQNGYVSGKGYSGGVILKTTDGGLSWTEIYNTGSAGDFVWKLQLFENNTHIYGSIQSNVAGRLVKSVDSGQTWETKVFFDHFVQAVGFITPLHGWMGGHFSGFYETIDGGDNWEPVGGLANHSLNRIFIINSNLAYASGTGVYKFSDGLSVSQPEGAPLKDISVVVSPNPLADQLNFSIDFQHTDNLVAELYDMNGRLLEKLIVDRINQAGTKSYSFDFPYAKGSYLLDLQTNCGRRSVAIQKQ